MINPQNGSKLAAILQWNKACTTKLEAFNRSFQIGWRATEMEGDAKLLMLATRVPSALKRLKRRFLFRLKILRPQTTLIAVF